MTLNIAVGTTLPDAVLWDLDGTIVDTEPVWFEAERSLAAQRGAAWSEQDALSVLGYDLREAAGVMRERMGLHEDVDDIVTALVGHVARHVREDDLAWRPGAREMIAALTAAGVPQALVTMSYQSIAEPLIDRFDANPFAAVITGDVVAQGKPHPEPYLTAAARLGFAPQRCVAIEDSNTGATSASAAGCQVLVVPNIVSVEPGERRTFATSLGGLTPYDLGRLLDRPETPQS